jgi:1-acyl-sn-glycerol-3-phosphate acyltransferase
VKYAVTFAFGLLCAVTMPLLFAFFLLVWAVTAPFDPDRHAVHAVVCRCAFHYLRVNPFWHVRVEGRERLPRGPCVLVSNHQSMADVVVAMGLFHRFKYVSKASLFRLPFVGWAMRLAKYVSLQRGRPHSTQEMMDSCRHWLRRGTPVLLYPEGTYAPQGTMLPFRRGPFRLAIEERVPVVPVILEGTRGLILGDGPWFQPRCRIRLRVLPPLPVDALGQDEAALAARVQALYERELGVKAARHPGLTRGKAAR